MVLPKDDPKGRRGRRPTRQLNARELAARRRNSKESTGARSKEGKARIARNALKHGGYAKNIPCIDEGPLAENRAEVDAFYAAMYEELDPRTPTQWVYSHELARLGWCLRRVHIWADLAFASIERAASSDPPRFVETHAERMAAQFALGADVLRDVNRLDIESPAFEYAVSMLYCALPDTTATPEWQPDEGIRPSSPDAWRALIERLISLGWSSRKDAANWANAQAEVARSQYEVELAGRAQLAVRTILSEGLLAKAMDANGRLSRQFSRLRAEYQDLPRAERPESRNKANGSRRGTSRGGRRPRP
jgi:hypothetical protein